MRSASLLFAFVYEAPWSLSTKYFIYAYDIVSPRAAAAADAALTIAQSVLIDLAVHIAYIASFCFSQPRWDLSRAGLYLFPLGLVFSEMSSHSRYPFSRYETSYVYTRENHFTNASSEDFISHNYRFNYIS